jgi:hypothetical protein
MGFIGRMDMQTTFGKREMGARDFIWLAALGSAARRPAGLEDMACAIDSITAGQWLPVGELVTASVEEMVRGGHLALAADGRHTLSRRGRETLSLLLTQPLARPASVFGQVGLRMKLAFLDLVEPGERRLHLESMIEGYEDELARRMSPCEGCTARGSFGELWRCHDLERLRRDLALLRSMAGGLGAPATRH